MFECTFCLNGQCCLGGVEALMWNHWQWFAMFWWQGRCHSVLSLVHRAMYFSLPQMSAALLAFLLCFCFARVGRQNLMDCPFKLNISKDIMYMIMHLENKWLSKLKSFSVWTSEQITSVYSLVSVCATCASDRDFDDITFLRNETETADF